MDTLRRIADATGPCITIVEPHGDAAKVEAALREIESQIPKDERESLLQPVREKLAELNGEKGTVVLLRSPEVNELHLTGEEMPALRTVTQSFLLRELLPLFQHPHEFYLLALSRNNTRILHCTATTSKELAFPKETPESLDDSKHSEKPDHDQQKRSGSAGPNLGAMKGVMSGVSTDADRQPEYMHNFFRTIDTAVHAITKENPLPLVLVGVESELAMYRTVNTYAQLAPTGVLGSPESYKGGEMHARALRALSTFIPPATEKTLNELDKLIGTGHASVHAADIVKAAHEGRVAHLFLQGGAEYLGTFDESRGKTHHHTADSDDAHNLLEDATRQTVLHGGQVTLLTGRQMPNGVPVCAVYRY